MKTFADNAGRTWTIAINVDVLKRVRGLVDVNLLDIIDGKLIERLYRDPVLLCDVVYAVCKPEADARNVSDEDFGRAMAGDAIEQATKVLLEELVLFSPSPRDRANLQRVLETTWRVMDKARDLVEARLATVDAEQIVVQALATSGTSSGSAPGLPASIPDG
ncbi:MAG: hypothetical protein KBG29_00400 [Pseudomonadales bacterium]|nr:hypothetical protein [Pseudomonadales bacterium]